MSAKAFFLDTNVVIYAFHSDSTEKRNTAIGLLKKAETDGGCMSFQVIREFVNAATRKFRPVPPVDEIRLLVRDILLPLCRITPNPTFYLDALETHQATRFSWYDSLILQAAVDSGCETLFSEDLQDGFRFRGVTVTNPFR